MLLSRKNIQGETGALLTLFHLLPEQRLACRCAKTTPVPRRHPSFIASNPNSLGCCGRDIDVGASVHGINEYATAFQQLSDAMVRLSNWRFLSHQPGFMQEFANTYNLLRRQLNRDDLPLLPPSSLTAPKKSDATPLVLVAAARNIKNAAVINYPSLSRKTANHLFIFHNNIKLLDIIPGTHVNGLTPNAQFSADLSTAPHLGGASFAGIA